MRWGREDDAEGGPEIGTRLLGRSMVVRGNSAVYSLKAYCDKVRRITSSASNPKTYHIFGFLIRIRHGNPKNSVMGRVLRAFERSGTFWKLGSIFFFNGWGRKQ